MLFSVSTKLGIFYFLFFIKVNQVYLVLILIEWNAGESWHKELRGCPYVVLSQTLTKTIIAKLSLIIVNRGNGYETRLKEFFIVCFRGLAQHKTLKYKKWLCVLVCSYDLPIEALRLCNSCIVSECGVKDLPTEILACLFASLPGFFTHSLH